MNRVRESLKNYIVVHKKFILYGLISVFVTVIDVLVCRTSECFFDAVVANTLGVVAGFVIQYFLTARHVYNTKSLKSFSIFLATWFVGLIVADTIVYLSRTYLFSGSDDTMAFLVSKGASIVIPFFFTYFLRKKIMPVSERNTEE